MKRVSGFVRFGMLFFVVSCGKEWSPEPTLTEKSYKDSDSISTTTDTDIDTDTNTFSTITDSNVDTELHSVMPNVIGFLKNDFKGNDLNIQGAWYWYDGERNIMEEVYANGEDDTVTSVATIEVPTVEYVYWLKDGASNPKADWNSLGNQRANDYRATEICARGRAVEQNKTITEEPYMALGFELCSTLNNNEQPEFPAPLGMCDNYLDLHQQLWGISFDLRKLEPFSDIERFEVQFKQYGTADSDQPVHKISVQDAEFQGKTIDGVRARVFDAMPGVDLSLLQAIHIQVVGSEDADEMAFCISNLNVITTNPSHNNGGIYEPFDTTCPNEPEIGLIPPPSSSFETELNWMPISSSADVGQGDSDNVSFEIMKNEVTVAQYAAFLNALQDNQSDSPESKYNWESCNVTLYQNGSRWEVDSGISLQEELGEHAANCVTWCRADQFCQWVGGALPKEEQWLRAFDEKQDTIAITCDDGAIINDPEKNGNACGNDRMPDKACANIPQDTIAMSDGGEDDRICDMVGNLWEWVSDRNKADDVYRNYRKLKGGGLNTMFAENERNYSTWEHPREPHNLTRLGFRCVK